MAELEKTGKMTPGSRVDIGRLGLGVVVRDGAPVPDISTPEAVKQALINAKIDRLHRSRSSAARRSCI